jgi:hypothetical protein
VPEGLLVGAEHELAAYGTALVAAIKASSRKAFLSRING